MRANADERAGVGGGRWSKLLLGKFRADEDIDRGVRNRDKGIGGQGDTGSRLTSLLVPLPPDRLVPLSRFHFRHLGPDQWLQRPPHLSLKLFVLECDIGRPDGSGCNPLAQRGDLLSGQRRRVFRHLRLVAADVLDDQAVFGFRCDEGRTAVASLAGRESP